MVTRCDRQPQQRKTERSGLCRSTASPTKPTATKFQSDCPLEQINSSPVPPQVWHPRSKWRDVDGRCGILICSMPLLFRGGSDQDQMDRMCPSMTATWSASMLRCPPPAKPRRFQKDSRSRQRMAVVVAGSPGSPSLRDGCRAGAHRSRNKKARGSRRGLFFVGRSSGKSTRCARGLPA